MSKLDYEETLRYLCFMQKKIKTSEIKNEEILNCFEICNMNDETINLLKMLEYKNISINNYIIQTIEKINTFKGYEIIFKDFVIYINKNKSPICFFDLINKQYNMLKSEEKIEKLLQLNNYNKKT